MAGSFAIKMKSSRDDFWQFSLPPISSVELFGPFVRTSVTADYLRA
jgi:hypothetical protein